MNTDIIHAHPCLSRRAHNIYGRLHLPVAPKCNISCKYCDRKIGECYHQYRPGISKQIISPGEALNLVERNINNDWLKVVGIAGPGEPLFNDASFETLKIIHEMYPYLILCISTNGLLLPKYLGVLKKIGIKTLTITINATDPKIANKIYNNIFYNKKNYSGVNGVKILIKNQLNGLELASKQGIITKVNTVYIPGINEKHLKEISFEIRKRGAYIQNIMPIIPLAEFSNYQSPTSDQLEKVRNECGKVIHQFRECRQCRADAIGIPGCK